MKTVISRISKLAVGTAVLLAGGSALACVSNAYYPIVEGATWTYQESEGFGYTQTILNVSADSFTVRMDMDGLEGPAEMEFLCDEDGILSMGNMQSMLPAGVEVEMVSMEGITYPTEWVVGETWAQEIVMRMEMVMEGMTALSTMTMSQESTIHPHESVTVPAGTFTALLMSADVTVTTVTSMMGMEIPFTVTTKTDTWMAEGVGMVRSSSDDGTVLELVSYSVP